MQILMPFEKKHLRRMMHLIPLLMLALYHPHCAKAIDPDDLPRIELTAENIISKEVWLRVKFVNVREPLEFVVERDGKQIAVGRIQKADTLIIDTTATPKRLHRYKVIQLEGNVRTLESDEFEVMTLDTTSHAVQWEVDTLGVRGTIFDVWAFSRDNIWAVGEIYIKDSTGKEDPVLYNVAKWNGQRWQSERAFLAPTYSIFAFAPNDLWIGSGTPYHWNGQSWQGYVYPGEGFYMRKIWGTSSSNLFAVGSNGSIIRFNGSSWQRMESGTSVDLEDVWGIDEKHMWATGRTDVGAHSVVLQFDGGKWTTLYDNSTKPPAEKFGFSSVWTDNTRMLFLSGSGPSGKFHIDTRSFFRDSGKQYFSYRIRGTSLADVFVSGQGSEVLHYNGSAWYIYPKIKALQGNFTAGWIGIHVQQNIVVIGGQVLTGLTVAPVVLRGYR